MKLGLIFGKRSVILLLSLAMGCLVPNAWAELAQNDPSSLRLRERFSDQMVDNTGLDEMRQYPYYSDYLEQAIANGAKDYQGNDIPFALIEGNDRLVTGVGGMESEAILWPEDAMEQVEFTVQVPQDGLYCLRYRYYPYQSAKIDAQRGFMLDGDVPFRELTNLQFPWLWREAALPTRNLIGDDVRPKQQLLEKWHEETLRDSSGYYSEPYRFFLTKGEHQLILTDLLQPVALASLVLCAPPKALPYEQVLASYAENGYERAKALLVFQAEDCVTEKNAASIQRIVSADPASEPFEYGYKRLNTFGGHYWRTGGQWVTWTFDIPEDGLYELGMRVLQNADGLPVYRSIYIDDDLPFEELSAYSIPADDDYQLHVLSQADGTAYQFYMTKGQHTFTQRIQVERYYAVVRLLAQVDDVISDVALRLLMLTGPNADPNYDYDIEKAMPDAQELLSEAHESILALADELNALSGGRLTAAESSFRQNASQLMRCTQNIPRLQKYAGDLTSVQGSLETWQQALLEQPLEIDYFVAAPVGTDWAGARSSLAQKAYASLSGFLLSFVKDYDNVDGIRELDVTQTIDVWASMGMESAEILKNLCDETFTPETGIAMNLSIMPAGQLNTGSVNALMLGIISGNAPDVALGAGKGTAVEFAIRDAVVDLSKLPGYHELMTDFVGETIRPDSFMGGQYALPERVDFRVLFYRKDIFQKLGIRVPETWEDVYTNTLPLLYQNNLEMYVPQDFIGFCMFLYQHGGEFYSDDGLSTLLGSPQGYAAFDDLVSLYTKYSLPYTTNFYNRFRIGDMPIGIGGIGEYMALVYGAPNLTGKWGIALIPGFKRADGTISRAYSGMTQTSAMILSKSEKQEAAWAFLQWWLSAETQSAYAAEVEVRIGNGSRINSANIEAFAELPMPPEDMEIILRALRDIEEPVGVLGSYYTERHIKNAWNRIVIDDASKLPVRDSYEQAVEDITREMVSKQEEYSHLVDAIQKEHGEGE